MFTVNVTSANTLILGNQGSATMPMLLVNTDSTNTVWVGNDPTIYVSAPNSIPLGPGSSIAFSGNVTAYGVTNGPTVVVAVVPQGTQYFLPASLNNLGGSKVYVQAGQPTGNIPLNSIWFDTSTDALLTWDGTAWVNEAFNAQNLIQDATILSAQIAAQAVGTEQLADAAVTEAQIASGAVGTSQIASQAVTGAQIADSTITATQLDNVDVLNPNPGFAGGSLAGWYAGAASGTAPAFTAVSTSLASYPYAGQIVAATGSGYPYMLTANPDGSAVITVAPGQALQCSAFVNCNIATNVVIAWYESNGTYISNVGSAVAADFGTWQYGEVSGVAPSGAQYAQAGIQMEVGSAAGTETAQATGIYVQSQVNGATITPGTLTTTQIAEAAGILGTQIADATITSGNIAANTIIASNIAADTILGSNIAADTITAGNIAAGTITAVNLAVTSSGGNSNPYMAGLDWTGWVGANYTTLMAVDASTSPAIPSGIQIPDALYITWSGASTYVAINANYATNFVHVGAAGTYVEVSGWIYSNQTSMTIGVIWCAGDGAYITQSTPAYTLAAANTWEFVSVTLEVPSTAGIVGAGVSTAISPATTGAAYFMTGWTIQAAINGGLIEAGTVTAAQIAAGTVVAGMVNGTTIEGATFEGTNWLENDLGMFLYSGTPASGNLIASIAPASGSNDGEGNAFGAGICIYGPDNAETQLAFFTSSTEGLLYMAPGNTMSGTYTPPQITTASQGSSTAEYFELQLGGGAASGAPASKIVLYGGSSDLSTSIPHVSVFGGPSGNLIADINQYGIAVGNPSDPNTNETWHGLTLGADWAANTTGVEGFWYRLLSTGDVMLAWDVTISSANPGTAGTLPAGYRPSSTVRLHTGWSGTGPTSYNEDFNPGLNVTSAGVITGIGLYVDTIALYGTAILPTGI